MNKLVIIVDCQFDFYNPNGALYVPHGEEAIASVEKLLSTLDKKNDILVFTQDYHPENHSSFAVNGGLWNAHCVAGERGSEIAPELLSFEFENRYFVFKGEDTAKEEYSAFINSRFFVNDDTIYIDGVEIKNISDNFEVIICGIAGDYCVYDTLITLQKGLREDIKVYLDGTASIDGGEKLKKYLKENNIKTYDC